MLTLSGSTATRSNFASSIAGFPVCMLTGPDGNLYFLSRTNSAVYKITFTGSSAPVITNQPQSITVSQGNPATFSVTATGTPPLSYQWRKNGVNINGATNSSYTIPSVVAADQGNYSVVVSNSGGSVTSNDASLTVTAPNQLPTATIITPVAGATYAAGDVVNYSGSATDPEDPSIPPSAFEWYVIFHHDAHTHPGPTAQSGVTSGSFTIPNIGETSANVFYRLYLVVTDSQGGKDTAFTDILPRTSTITLNSNPQGLQLTLDGQPFTAPLTVTSVEGMMRTIDAPSPQGVYIFNNWSQGGNATQTFATPVNDVVYTANYTAGTITTLTPIADAYVNGGKDANNNFGSEITLLNQKNSSVNKTFESYLKFDISSFSANVSSAKLRLNGRLNNTQTPSIPVEVHNSTNTSWLENTITWNNKPAADAAILATININSTTNQYYEWDVTQHIASLRNSGVNTVTLKLVNSNSTNNQVVFNSKEAAANGPQLVVTDAGGAITRRVEAIESNGLVNILIYPNPVKDQLIIQNNAESAMIKLYDLSGRLIRQHFLTGNATQVDVTNLKNGMYLLKIDNEKGTVVKKIFVEK